MDSAYVYSFIAVLNKYQLTLNSCMYIYCFFVMRGEFLVVLIIHIIQKKATQKVTKITSLSHIGQIFFSM
jgi:hypothetical protein